MDRRVRYAAVVLLGLAALVLAMSVATAAPVVRVDRHDFRAVWPEPTVVNGHLMWGVGPLFHEVGGKVSMSGREVRVVRGSDTMVFRVGDRRWSFNGRRRDFSVAPMIQDGYVRVPVREIVSAVGGKLTWDRATGVADITLSGRKIAVGPNECALDSPRCGEYLKAEELPVVGYTTPDSDVKVTLYRLTIGQEPAMVGDVTTIRSDSRGKFDTTLPVAESGEYRVKVETLNGKGDVAATQQGSVRIVKPTATSQGNTVGAADPPERIASSDPNQRLAERGERREGGRERGEFRGGEGGEFRGGERGEFRGERGEGGEFRERFGEPGEFRGFFPRRESEEEEEHELGFGWPFISPPTPYYYPYGYPYGNPYYYYPPDSLQLTIPFRL